MGVGVLCGVFLLKLPGETPPRLSCVQRVFPYMHRSHSCSSDLILSAVLWRLFWLRQKKGTLVVVALRDVETKQVLLKLLLIFKTTTC